MMKRTEIAKLYANAEAYTDGEITVAGWIRANRDSKALGFMQLNDGSCFSGVQVVFEREKLVNYSEIAKLNTGAAVIVKGKALFLPPTRSSRLKSTLPRLRWRALPLPTIRFRKKDILLNT